MHTFYLQNFRAKKVGVTYTEYFWQLCSLKLCNMPSLRRWIKYAAILQYNYTNKGIIGKVN